MGIFIKTFNILKTSTAAAVTINEITTAPKRIKEIMDAHTPVLESMEGAAFFFCCMNEKIPCLQIRSISNYVEKRNKENWDIPLALKNLHSSLVELLSRI